jgi:hypothetical protein
MGKINIGNLVKKVLEESIQEKADDLVGKIKSKMDEWNQEVNISNQPSDMVQEDEDIDSVPNPDGCKKIKEMMANGGEDSLGKLEEYCGKGEIEEGLSKGQKFIAKQSEPKDKINKDDFTKLRNKSVDKVNKKYGGRHGMEEESDFDFSFSDEVNESEKKWIQKTDMKKGELHKKLGIPEGENLSISKLKNLKKELMKKGEGDKKLSASDSKLLKQVNLALTLKDVKESKKDTLSLSESEMIDLIQTIVMEQKKSKGMGETEKVLSANKKENDSAIAAVTKKMKEYLKNMTKGSFEENPEEFPKSNYQIDKDAKIKKYTPSEAVDEYIDAFSYPGMTNLVYDEIKPDDELIDKYLKGDSTTGNAVTDKKGKALGNVVPSKVGEKFKKNYDENLYGQEQMKASYKRYPQPVDFAGDVTKKGGLKSKKTAQSVLNKVDESTKKETNVLNEEFNKMKHLMDYNKKTQ